MAAILLKDGRRFFPYFRIIHPKRKVEEAASKLPTWLHDLHCARYESSTDTETTPTIEAAGKGQVAFNDRIFLNRILGLSNLYYIDPEDDDILQELREVRLQTVQLIISVTEMS